ncbi:aldehyde dehydrogenase family protein [Streptomyces yanii]|uniref:Aldehyde dehydrogenase family protein n=1 Tax=Streptomyces yanii TaxID=78510 RepID=A0ABV5R2D0_9ACTN
MSTTNALFIGGEWQSAASGAEFDTLDPATGQPNAQVADAGAADADAAVTAARRALQPRVGRDHLCTTRANPVAHR